MVHYGGVGHHVLWLCVHNPTALVIFAKLQIPLIIFLTLAIGFAKIAMLFMFLRIFLIQTIYRYMTFALMAIQVGTMISVIVVDCLVCTPISYLWEPELHPGGHCVDINAFWRWASFPQILTDLAILILPLPALMKLTLSRKDKIGVIATFCTGGM